MKAQLEQAKILMPPHPLTNFEIQKYQNKPKFNVFIQESIYLK